MQQGRGNGRLRSNTGSRRWLAAVLVIGTLTMAPAATADVRTTLPTSAWQKVAPNALNVAFPDENTVYFFLPYLARGGLTTVIEGQPPSARFWSHTIYQTQGGVLDNLPGDEVVLEPDGSYRLTIADSCAGVEGNCLSTTAVARPTPSVAGTLVYRLYVPADIGSTQTGGAALPRVSYVADGPEAEADLSAADQPAASAFRDEVVGAGATSLQTASEQPTLLSRPVPAPDNDPPVRSFRFRGHQGTAIDFLLTKGVITEPIWAQLNATLPNPSGQGGPFSTPSNEYAYILYEHDRGNLVLRAKAPTYRAQFPDPENDLARADGSEQVRYWSVCTNSVLTRYVDCLRDEDIVIAPGEDEFEVVASPTCPVAGYANCLLTGNEGVEFGVIYRNQYASESFAPFQLAGEWTFRGEYVAR